MSPQRPNGARPSLSPPEGGAGSRSRDGRTPPPAPSAAWARRAREIREDEGVSGVKPPVPVEQEVDTAGTLGSPVGSGYRRARAGTMPSKLQEGRFTLPDDEPTPTLPPAPDGYVRTSALSPAYPSASPTRPVLRHTASSAAGLPSAVTQPDLASAAGNANRHRSGSLGLPSNALGNAFGTSPFSHTWLANPGGPVPSPLGQQGDTVADHDDPTISFQSPSDSHTSLATDQLNFSTLDYLGLADGNDMPPASMAEARSLAQRAIAQQGVANRHRANTVSNFARPNRASVTDEYAMDNQEARYPEEAALAAAMDHLNIYGGMSEFGMGLKDAHRPRATTVGTLDNPRRARNSNGSNLASIPQSPVQANLMNPLLSTALGHPARSRSDHNLARSRDSSTNRHGPRMSMSSHTSRAGTPDIERGSSTPQIPTRSLWIGNLDVNASSEALLAVFAPYGSIESVRLLPEKTCAFVNFMDRSDAIRARDDVLNRLGGYISALSETAPVRIGFGKIDSAPVGPVVSTVAPAPPGLVFTNGHTAAISMTPSYQPTHPPAGFSSPDQSSEQSTMPTRALWIGSIPGTTSSSTLLQIFSPFGPVESARVLMHKCCGFINFERLDSAVSARNALNGQEILGSDIGPIRIGFARIPTKTPVIGGPEEPVSQIGKSPERLGEALNTVKGAAAVSTETQVSAEGGGVENYRSPLVIDLVKAGVHEQVLEKGLAPGGVVSDQQMIMQVLSAGRSEEDGDVKAAADTKPASMYYTSIPNVLDRTARRFDIPKLKEYRKRLDAGGMGQAEIDTMALELLDDCSELSSDHIGNTVIQKLYERVSFTIRFAMLERIAPNLASIGIHKNGTWAAQKIIECSTTEAERLLIAQYLRPFAPPLMCDSLGNYVCAGSLRFGEPYNEYVYDAMVDRMWEIAQNRFGARCMRTCLESVHTSLYQKKRISTGIILNAIPLSTNPNGALLLTWLVDQSNLPGRYSLLANRFAPHISHLCTHKLASLTVLRVISQSSEPGASTTLTSAIFTSPNNQTLIDIVGDANNGVQVIGKILATSSIPAEERESMIAATRAVLPDIKASSTPPYRSLLEAVGLPIPSGPAGYQRNGMNGQGHAGLGGWRGYARGGGYTPHFYSHQMGYSGYGPQFAPNAQGMEAQGSSGSVVPRGQLGGQGGQSGHAGEEEGMGQGMGMGQGQPAGLAPIDVGGSPRTPVPRPTRISPSSQMMSPGSDPFNPFASPSIDVPYLQSHGQMRLTNGTPLNPNANPNPNAGAGGMRFEPQPNVGGLGFGMQQSQGIGMGMQQMGMGMGMGMEMGMGARMYYPTTQRQGQQQQGMGMYGRAGYQA